ncbi:S9 family peptidase [Nocardia sp. BMG111209]|uniref:alpha/beta hydrolase family protein n=1 Tax=Nocardia sp. BMG111209 TaxID=1160137 RepID=UPI00037A0825|nr:alpha/beta hydrolase [Nocardia sp. BMG111209]
MRRVFAGNLISRALWRRIAALAVCALLPLFWAGSATPATAGAPSVRVVTDPRLPGHTIYLPAEPTEHTPVLIWGEGGCVARNSLYVDFLSTVAARGIVVIDNSDPDGIAPLDQTAMNASVDWAVAENGRPDGPYSGRLDAGHIAVAGWSCGGLQSYELAVSRPEIATVGILNSGQIAVDQSQLDRLRVPVLYLLGGPTDIAYENGVRDFGQLPPDLPAFLGSSDTGHFGTYFQPGGGAYAALLGNWIRWRIAGDPDAGRTFTGPACGLCTTPGWTVRRRNIE